MKNEQGVVAYLEDMLGASCASENEWVADCPACGKEMHFSFHVYKRVGHCWVCGYAVNLLQLVCDMEGCAYAEAQKKVDAGSLCTNVPADMSEALRILGAGTQKQNKEGCSLPYGSVDILSSEAAQGLTYLRMRGFSDALAQTYKLQYVVPADRGASYLFNHIVFPVHDNDGRLIFWATRYAGEYVPKGRSKAYNARRSKPDILFGAAVNTTSTCILVEGALDAMAVYPHGLALFGKRLSVAQAYQIACRYARVVVCLDLDAENEREHVRSVLAAAGVGNIMYADMPTGYSDPAEMLQTKTLHVPVYAALEVKEPDVKMQVFFNAFTEKMYPR